MQQNTNYRLIINRKHYFIDDILKQFDFKKKISKNIILDLNEDLNFYNIEIFNLSNNIFVYLFILNRHNEATQFINFLDFLVDGKTENIKSVGNVFLNQVKTVFDSIEGQLSEDLLQIPNHLNMLSQIILFNKKPLKTYNAIISDPLFKNENIDNLQANLISTYFSNLYYDSKIENISEFLDTLKKSQKSFISTILEKMSEKSINLLSTSLNKNLVHSNIEKELTYDFLNHDKFSNIKIKIDKKNNISLTNYWYGIRFYYISLSLAAENDFKISNLSNNTFKDSHFFTHLNPTTITSINDFENFFLKNAETIQYVINQIKNTKKDSLTQDQLHLFLNDYESRLEYLLLNTKLNKDSKTDLPKYNKI